MSFIGRGEKLAGKILLMLIPTKKIQIIPQFPIEKLITKEEFQFLDPIYQKHKFDFVIFNLNQFNQPANIIAVEVNYKHGEGAARKMARIFRPLLENHGIKLLTIDDYDCRDGGLFYLNSKKEHKTTWDDFRDVIDALEKAGIEPKLT